MVRRTGTGDERPPASPRVGLFGRLGSGNIGNDATLEAMLAYLRSEHPGAVLDCMCSGPTVVRQRYGIPATSLHWLHADRPTRPRWLRAGRTGALIAVGALIDACRTASWVRRHDVVVVPGMGVFESTLPQRPWQLPYSLFLMSVFGRLFGTKVAFVSIGATVVAERLTGRLLAAAGRFAHYRSFRDDYSLDAARTMRMAGAGDRVHPDLVFALPGPDGHPASSRTVGVGVMAYSGGPADRGRAQEIHDGYVARMTSFVRWLVDTGHRVRLLIGDAADEPVAEVIRAEVNALHGPSTTPPVAYEPFCSVEELMAQLAPLDTVVATRFHNVLVAVRCAKPTIAIGYGRKHVALMAQMGVADFVQDIRSLDVGALEEMFTALESDRERISRTLSERSRRNRALLADQFDELTAVLFEPASRPVTSAVR